MSEKKHKILVVDDEPSNIEVIIQNFGEQDYNILAATNGEMATMLAETINPELIILDWQMPGMSGLDVIKELKNKKSTENIVIIMATAIYTSSENLKEALEAGAYDFLRKPFDSIELEARVKSALSFINLQKKIQTQQKELFEQKESLLNESLAHKKRKLMSDALQIIRQNEMNVTLIEELIKLLPETNGKTNKAIRELINKYKIQATNNGWNEFENRFEHLHNQFYDKLREKYPNLTQNEFKLCAFLRLNMSLGEIMAITSQSSEGIRKAKFRLRKKMNVENDSNLINLLTKL